MRLGRELFTRSKSRVAGTLLRRNILTSIEMAGSHDGADLSCSAVARAYPTRRRACADRISTRLYWRGVATGFSGRA